MGRVRRVSGKGEGREREWWGRVRERVSGEDEGVSGEGESEWGG